MTLSAVVFEDGDMVGSQVKEGSPERDGDRDRAQAPDYVRTLASVIINLCGLEQMTELNFGKGD